MLGFIRNIVYKIPIDKGTQEVILEALRWALFAGLSAAVGVFLNVLADLDQNTFVLVATIVLRGIDKWLYARQKDRATAKSEAPTGLLGV